MIKRFCLASVLAGFCVVVFSNVCAAQTTTGTIAGSVRDETGAVLPGVTVTVKNTDTGFVRSVVTDTEGRYRVSNLPLGNYEVQAELASFRRRVRTGITLTIGREAAGDFILSIGQIEETLTVKGEAPLLETTTSEVAGLVREQQIRDLPLNGRSFEQLAALQTAVSVSRSAGSGFDSGQTQKISVAGARPNLNRFLLDGNDVNDLRQKTPGSAAGVFLGVETVREFKVLTSTYSAEYGATAGAVITAVSKSGTNNLRSSLFWFHRNDSLDALNYFDPGPESPEFMRNQFGLTLGGPIVKDKTFFFGSYEGLRQRLTVTRIWNVFSEDARRGFLRDPSGALDFVGVNPNVQVWLDAYPPPNGRDFGNGVAEYVAGVLQPTREDYGMAKIDHRFSADDWMFARFTMSDGDSFGAGGHPVNPSTIFSHNRYLTLEETHLFSPRWLNVARFGYNRSDSRFSSSPIIDLPASAELVPGKPLLLTGSVGAGRDGPVALGTESRAPLYNNFNLFEFSDDLTYTRGRHSVKTGVLLKTLRLNMDTPRRSGGSLDFASIRDYLLGRPRIFVAPPPGEDDAARRMRQWVLGLYIRDDLKARSNLTLNLGLRYEISSGATEMDGKLGNMMPGDSEITQLGNPLFPTPSYLNFAPRVGFAWDPFNDGKTAVRGGYGIYYSANFPAEWEAATRNAPFYSNYSVSRPTFPIWNFFLSGAQVPLLEPTTLEVPNVETMHQWNLNVQRQIATDMVVTAGYVGSLGRHLFRMLQVNINEFTIVDGKKFFRPNSRNSLLGDHKHMIGDGNAYYNGLILGVSKQFGGGLQAQASYTYSKNISDADNVFGREVTNATPGVQDPLDRTAARGLSSYDVRHNLSANFTIAMPFGPGRRIGGNLTGFAAALAEGWQVSGIVSLASGPPFSLTSTFNRSNSGTTSSTGSVLTERPNLREGFSNNPVNGTSQGCSGVPAGTPLGTPDRYYDPCAFELQSAGFYGNLGRNTLTGPGFASVDLSLVKETRIAGAFSLQLRFEIFNLLNRANFALPTRNIFTNALGVPAADAGRITETVGTARQMQLGAKFSF